MGPPAPVYRKSNYKTAEQFRNDPKYKKKEKVMADNNIRRTKRPTANQRRRLSDLSIDANEEQNVGVIAKDNQLKASLNKQDVSILFVNKVLKTLANKLLKKVKSVVCWHCWPRSRRAGGLGLAISAGEAIGNQLKNLKSVLLADEAKDVLLKRKKKRR